MFETIGKGSFCALHGTNTTMHDTPKFGPGGNAENFYAKGMKHTWQAPAWLAAQGLDAYEYQCGNGVTGSVETFERIGREARAHGILLSLHAPYFISLSGVNPETRLKSIGYIKRSLEAAEAMGADTIVIHTGSAGKIPREEAMKLAEDTLWKTLEEVGDTEVHLGLETMGKRNQLGTLDEVITLCSLDSRLYPVVDFGHLNARDGGHCFDHADDYRRVFDQIADRLGAERAIHLHCHFSHIEYTDAGEKKHLTFADTAFGPAFEPLAEAICIDRLAPRLICESAGTMAQDALSMKKSWMAAADAAH